MSKTPPQTPGGHPFDLPTRKLEEAIGEEWAPGESTSKGFQDKPLTQLAATAIDGKADDATEKLLTILQNDNLLYWTDHPKELVDLEEKNWRPLMEALNHAFHLALEPSFGFHLKAPSPTGLVQVNTYLQTLNPFQRTALLEMASLAHSFILPWALVTGHLPSPLEAWDKAQLHERFEANTWGADPESQKADCLDFQSLKTAYLFFTLSYP